MRDRLLSFKKGQRINYKCKVCGVDCSAIYNGDYRPYCSKHLKEKESKRQKEYYQRKKAETIADGLVKPPKENKKSTKEVKEQGIKALTTHSGRVPTAYKDVLTDHLDDIMDNDKTSVHPQERISIIAFYSDCKNYKKTSEHFKRHPSLIKKVIDKYPRVLKYFDDKNKREVVKMLDSVNKSALYELDRRLKEAPDKFSNVELNLVAGTAFDKKRIEEGKPEKIIKFDSEATMQDILKKINEEMQNAKVKPFTVVPKEDNGEHNDNNEDGRSETQMESETAS